MREFADAAPGYWRTTAREAAKERNAFADLIEGKDAGLEAVFEVGGEIGDLVGEIDQLRFKRRARSRKYSASSGWSGRSSRASV